MATADDLARGRDSFDRQAWGDAFAQLSAADRRVALAPDDLERLATAAYLLGNDADSTAIWARAYQNRLDQGEVDRAARCAIWLAFVLMLTGATARAGGWLARAERLLDDGRPDCVEQGYRLVPGAFQHLDEDDNATAYATLARAAFRPDFGWIELPVIGDAGQPVHERGVVSAEPGLYFVGLPFQYALTSSLVGGVGRDAEHIAKHIVSNGAGRDSGIAVGDLSTRQRERR